MTSAIWSPSTTTAPLKAGIPVAVMTIVLANTVVLDMRSHPFVQASTTARKWSARLQASGPASVATTMSSMRAPKRPLR